jgi:hypothetical protein
MSETEYKRSVGGSYQKVGGSYQRIKPEDDTEHDSHYTNQNFTKTTPNCPHKFITSEEIAKKLHGFDNFLYQIGGRLNEDLASYAILEAFRMQFHDYYFRDKNYKQWDENNQ